MAKKYQIITARDTDELEEKVRAAIYGGWFPQGGVCVASKDSLASDIFYQAMTEGVFSLRAPNSTQQAEGQKRG